jgi:hypothetical protein
VPVSKAWRQVHLARFAEFPLDCGNARDPGVIYNDDIRNWSDKPTTPDQKRIELYIDRYDLSQKRILHIGIGDSGLALRFHGRVREIVGTTIDEPEMMVARARALPRYTHLLHNKFTSWDRVVEGKFDFIIDNNPTSPCCCLRHLEALFDFYDAKLAEGGQIVTDRQGLKWVPRGSDSRWGLNFEDLLLVASAAGFSAHRMNRTVYVLSRTTPRRPGIAPLSQHLWRRVKKLPGQIVRDGPRATALFCRRSLKWVLISFVPWALPARYRPAKSASTRRD